MVNDAIIISDIHLGYDVCQVKNLETFLSKIHHHTDNLILNGDVFNSLDFSRLKKHHWHILSILRKLSNKINVIWIRGNHDGQADIISHLLGINVVDEYIVNSGDKNILILHGDQFDSFIDDHPFLTWIGDTIYGTLQKIDKSHYFARIAKKGSKHFLRCEKLVENGANSKRIELNCDMVCCGHTHNPKENHPYYNSGCWTENPGSYLEVKSGVIQVKMFGEDDILDDQKFLSI